jgi:hypothetical protein
MDNLRPGGAFRGKGRQLVGKVGEWYLKSRHLQGCSPRLCRLRTEGLVPLSKYWTYRSHPSDMGPVSLVVGCQQKLDFSPLFHWLLWERSWVQSCGLDGRYAMDYVGSPSSRVQWVCSNLLMTVWKVATYGDWPQEAYAGCTWTGVGSVRVVLVGFSPARCTLMSNRLFVAAIK